MIKKLLVPVLCVLLGCAGGAAMGSVTAQTWPEPATVQRWQQECLDIEGHTPGSRRRSTNTTLAERGGQGWEAFALTESIICFKRPAP
jgi:hypothetical protein